MMRVIVSIDGEIVPPERATISVLDRGFLYGDGAFEVLRTWNGVAVELDAHLDRLYAAAAALQLAAIDRARLAEHLRAAVSLAGTPEHRIRIVLTRGPGPLSARLASLPAGRAIVIVEPLPPQPHELSLAIVDWPLPRRARGYKTLAYLDHVIARELAAAAGADEAVRLDEHGCVAECATSNLFAVVAGVVVTPPAETDVLAGIVRERVLALCDGLGHAREVRPFTVAELLTADETFVTSSLRGVVPVTRLEGEPRVRGPLARRIARAYIDDMTGRSNARLL